MPRCLSWLLLFGFVFQFQVSQAADFFFDREFVLTPIGQHKLYKRLSPHPPNALAKQLAANACRYLGAPYCWAGVGPHGFDCSGLIYHLFGLFHVRLPRMADEQYRAGIPVARNKLQQGDLVFFSTYTSGISHVGIYIGADRFIHASPMYGVSIAKLSEPYFSLRYRGARRIAFHVRASKN